MRNLFIEVFHLFVGGELHLLYCVVLVVIILFFESLYVILEGLYFALKIPNLVIF